MANTVENRLKFTTEGLEAFTKARTELDAVGQGALATGQRLDELRPAAQAAGKQVEQLSGQAQTSSRQVDGLGRSTQTTRAQLDGLGGTAQGAGRQLESLGGRGETMRKGMQSISTQLEQAKTALLGFAGLQGAGSLVTLSDEFKTLNSRLLVSSDNAGQAAAKYRELFAVAQQTRGPFSELVDLSSRISNATEGSNVSQVRQIGLVRTISQAMTIGGGSAEGMRAAIVQLGQGMASGTLRGEELNSILEQAPRLAKALADGLGVSVGELRKLGAAGQLTSQDVLRALENSAAKVGSEFAKMVPTIGQSATKLRNAVLDALGNLDRDLGKSDGLSRFLSGMAEGLTKTLPQVREFIKETKPLLDFATTLAAIAAAGGALKWLGGAAVGVAARAAALNPAIALPAAGAAALYAADGQINSADGRQKRLDVKLDYQRQDQADLDRLSRAGGSASASEISRLQKDIAARQVTIDTLRADVAHQRAAMPGAGSSSVIGDSYAETDPAKKPAVRYFSADQALGDLGAPTQANIQKKYNDSLSGFLKKANEDLVKAVEAGDKPAEAAVRAKITQGVNALQRERNDALFGLSRPSAAANEAFKKQVDALAHTYKVSEIALKSQVDVIDSRLKRGDMGELQAAQAKFAAQSGGLDQQDKMLTDQRDAAVKGGFKVEASRYELELADSAAQRKALALRLAEDVQAIEERNVAELLGLEAKNFADRGQLVQAFIADYQKTYAPALRKALLDGNEGMSQGLLAVYGSGLKHAQEGEQKEQFDKAQARFNARKGELTGSLQSARSELVQSGDGEAYEQRLSAAYSMLLPQLRAAQSEMRTLAGENEKLVASTEQAGKDIGELQLRSLRSFGDGIKDANAEYFAAVSNMADQGKRVMQEWNRTAESAFIEFAKTGKVNVTSLADFIIAEMARAAYQKGFAKPLADLGGSVLQTVFGGNSGGGGRSGADEANAYPGGGDGGGLMTLVNWGMKLFGANHGGGIAGQEATFSKMAHPGVFAGAPRFHTGGLVGGEVPIIAQRGEGVFTRGQMAALAPVGQGASQVVNVVVQPTPGQTATVSQNRGADGALDVVVMLRQIDEGLADLTQAGQSKNARATGALYGIRPAVA